MVDKVVSWGLDVAALPRHADETMAERHWRRWRQELARRDDPALADLAGADLAGEGDAPSAVTALLQTLFANSPYLSQCLIADPVFAHLLLHDGPDAAQAEALATAAAGAADQPEAKDALMRRLRLAKRRSALAIGVGDITGVWALEKVTGGLSELAETALHAACRNLMAELHRAGHLAPSDPAAPEQDSGLFVLGMGKFGARELNYSSDIDLIVLFDQQAPAQTGGAAMPSLFAKMTRELIRIIGHRDQDGYVFRTDLRLRPDPGSTPVAVSVESALNYYQNLGRNWERAAMIKARTVAGDTGCGERFLESLQSFIWRRRLDFEGGLDIRAMKRQIDAAHGDEEAGLAGRNVKLGVGGIREIEFFAQAQQLIWGGREPALRVIGTLEGIDVLVAGGHVRRRASKELAAAYRFLRRVEHRLQMTRDEQTHSLPKTEVGMADIVAFMGFASEADFATEIRHHTGIVSHWFGTLFDEAAQITAPVNLSFSPDGHDPATLESLGKIGFSEPEQVSAIVGAWFGERYPALRAERAQGLLKKLLPGLLQAFAGLPHPEPGLKHFDGFLARLPDGVAFFASLTARPDLMGLIAEIMGEAPALASELTRHPDLIDSVLMRDFTDLSLPEDPFGDSGMDRTARRGLVRLFYALELTAEEMARELAAAVDRVSDRQDRLDVVRRWAKARQFQIGIHILRGVLSPVEASAPLCDIAEVCIDALMKVILDEFTTAHGRIAGGAVAIIAFGKLGSREMNINSDLDLMFLYDHDAEATASDGARPLPPGEYYGRLCRRLIGDLSALTGEGKLYDVDMRLRPSGHAGPIACSRESFALYQQDQAWTWEHQALTRSRVVYGEAPLATTFNEVRLSVLTRPRDAAKLAAEVVAMRDRIRAEHGDGDIWSIKHRRGGLIDVEFIAQYLQLSAAAAYPEILAGDPIMVFEKAAVLGIIDDECAEELTDAVRLWRDMQGIVRMTAREMGGEKDMILSVRGIVERAAGSVMYDALVESMAQTAERVTGRFRSLLGEV